MRSEFILLGSPEQPPSFPAFSGFSALERPWGFSKSKKKRASASLASSSALDKWRSFSSQKRIAASQSAYASKITLLQTHDIIAANIYIVAQLQIHENLTGSL